MSDLRSVRDFFKVHLPEKIKEKVNLETLEIEKNDFITRDYSSI
ncbi:MAG: Rpn family recombination-promoting nuclease/putative transposase [Legionellales bacterium]|nr:Rpn family recombination-promoting nuclease/putative transposase [Legionellales bacterium]